MKPICLTCSWKFGPILHTVSCYTVSYNYRISITATVKSLFSSHLFFHWQIRIKSHHLVVVWESDGDPVVAVLRRLLLDDELDDVSVGGRRLPDGLVLAVVGAVLREPPRVDANLVRGLVWMKNPPLRCCLETSQGQDRSAWGFFKDLKKLRPNLFWV